MPGHICWMRKEELTPKILEKYRNAKFLFFDLETYKDENGKYIPNYAVVQDDEGNQQSFPEDLNDMGSDITKQLCDYLFHERYKGYFIVAHNFRGEFPDDSVNVGVCVCVCEKHFYSLLSICRLRRLLGR
jgi:hypothetical protein